MTEWRRSLRDGLRRPAPHHQREAVTRRDCAGLAKDAFTEFLDNHPPNTGMAFVLIQHLDPVHKSLLVSLLAPHTAMQVVEAADGMPLVPNTVFVIPPDATMTISNDGLAVSSPPRVPRKELCHIHHRGTFRAASGILSPWHATRAASPCGAL
jgi:hypothetical protein